MINLLIMSLNKDTFVLIAQKLDYQSVLNASRTCSSWYRLSQSDTVWHHMVREKFGDVELSDIYEAKNFKDVLKTMIKCWKYVLKEAEAALTFYPSFLHRSSEKSMMIPLDWIDIILPRRGDTLLDLSEWGYRMNGISYWDGNKRIAPDYGYDDYGHVPIQFAYPEFPIDYFYHGHSHLVHVKNPVLENDGSLIIDGRVYLMGNGSKLSGEITTIDIDWGEHIIY